MLADDVVGYLVDVVLRQLRAACWPSQWDEVVLKVHGACLWFAGVR